MRVKRKKHGAERLEACGELIINDLKEAAGEPKNLFQNDNPVRIEIGCGKGDFIVGTALQHPEWNFIAVERISDVIVTAAEKVKESGLCNIRLCCCDASDLGENLNDGTVDGIYLNFSDPWPKSKHYKRRLTYRAFLEMYKKLLKKEGGICFKTDNRGLFDFSLEEFEAADLRVEKVTYDLHNSEYMEGNVMTEYERRFSEMGTPINRAEAYKKC